MGALVTMVMILSAAPAFAGSTTILCTGFTGCLGLGRSDAGYGSVYLQSFWSMTAGHNCTNYVAYRLTHGRTVARPPGTSNASTWGSSARSAGITVDDRPRVGAVAWWNAGYHGASSMGHVAYVEAVLLDGTVLVSEDNYGGDFHWRVLSRVTGNWPSGFIQYPESDGSPKGELLSVESPEPGQIDFWGTSSDPDAGSGDREYLITLGGPRGTPGVESFQISSPWFRFHWIRPVSTRGETTMYLYALNEAGTAGGDTLLGTKPVTIRSSSAVDASMVDSSIRRTQKPKVRMTLAPTVASGTVDVWRGSTRVATASLASGEQRTVTLPRQRRGRWTLKVKFRGSTTYVPSKDLVALRVR